MVVFNIPNSKVTEEKPLKNSDSNIKSEETKITSANEENKKTEKIETCYTCGKKFDMNKEDGSRYRYEKFPLCAYCAEFYGFYFNDPGQKRKEK
jgi:hypothetical protein